MVIRIDTGPREAQAIVFIHGSGVAGWMWKKQIEAFRGMRSIVIDLPDHGLALAQEFRSIEETADEIARFVSEGVPGGTAHLVGHSLGAKIVLEILSRHPETARSAVVSSALVRPSALVSLMNSHALNAMSLWMLKSEAVARAQAAQFAFPDPDMTASFLSELGAMKAENLDRPIAAFAGRLFLPPDLDRVTCPVLVTAGSQEPRSMIGSQADIALAMPGARTALIQGAKHSYPWTHYAIYNSYLTAFLGGKDSASEVNDND